jgi:hypothetical protein
VWFVEAGGRAVPARWAGKRFEHAVRPDVKVEDAGMAYSRNRDGAGGGRAVVPRRGRRGSALKSG